ncbi:hypothetical protein ACP4OV_017690 [Aristida adscensionis]
MAARAILSSRLAGLAPAAAAGIGRRAYSAAAARKVVEPVDAARTAAAAAGDKAATKPQMEYSWMRDPKTGYWMPENHLDGVGAADLRARMLPSFRKD